MAEKKKGLLGMLGSGGARKAGDAIVNRQRQIDEAVDGPKPKKKPKK